MWRIALAFIDIALHRRSPADLPASQFLLGLVLVAYVAIGLISVQLEMAFARALGIVLVDTLLYLSFTWLLLKSFRRSLRFTQTATALLGTSSLLALLAIPLFVWNRAYPTGDVDLTPPVMLALLLLLWSIDIGGYVLSRALDKAYIVGVLIVIVYALASMELRGMLFPPIA